MQNKTFKLICLLHESNSVLWKLRFKISLKKCTFLQTHSPYYYASEEEVEKHLI